MKINKLLYICLTVPTLLMGCGEGLFKEEEIKRLYNEHSNLNPKVKSVDNISCHQKGYLFPKEKKRPFFECSYDLESETGQEVKEEAILMQDEAGRLTIQGSALLEGSNVRY